ncbi:MAG: hypothetical protein DIZ77_10315 [endosymbiont of Seepiophila jonesi]|uniref:EAL domain-containing protein n=1 Tax=endosymbiont of Lamellibrachia luymesi TaxID=2200907 RepID=A0A370DXH7_9GAMM|nr:MAG: hypothetical protein DIZ79_11220 [endosymbiont of Lamellibrachia luymesi]RDH91718.1 MAG: hypothetical protein DIZ77_10315 [endosymbiont of Seepiophila jonesi]
MERDQFKLFFQPQIDIQTGELIGAEALLRWRHPERGYILPDHFIPVVTKCKGFCSMSPSPWRSSRTC